MFEFTLIVFNTSPFGNLTNQIFPHLDQLIFIPKKKTSIFSRLLYLFKKVKNIDPFVFTPGLCMTMPTLEF